MKIGPKLHVKLLKWLDKHIPSVIDQEEEEGFQEAGIASAKVLGRKGFRWSKYLKALRVARGRERWPGDTVREVGMERSLQQRWRFWIFFSVKAVTISPLSDSVSPLIKWRWETAMVGKGFGKKRQSLAQCLVTLSKHQWPSKKSKLDIRQKLARTFSFCSSKAYWREWTLRIE